jgi:serine/threonine protein kinase
MFIFNVDILHVFAYTNTHILHVSIVTYYRDIKLDNILLVDDPAYQPPQFGPELSPASKYIIKLCSFTHAIEDVGDRGQLNDILGSPGMLLYPSFVPFQ